MRRFFGILAVIGFILSVIVHGLTFLGVDPQQDFRFVWLLHIGIFVVWIPAVIISKKDGTLKGDDFWRIATQGWPRWMKVLPGILFGYILFNFFFSLFVLNEGGNPSVINGEKVLHSHGRIIRKLTDQEYHLHKAYLVRGFSGHWLLFYAVAAVILYPERKQEQLAPVS